MSSLREKNSFSKNIDISYVEWFFGKKADKLNERIKYSPDTKTSLLCEFNKNLSGILEKNKWYFLCNNKEDVPCHPFLKRGSMTIEAALVVPLFLFACIIILSIIDVIRITMENEASIHRLAREAVVYGYPGDEITEGGEGDYINLSISYPVSLPVKAFGLGSLDARNHCYAHIFNGYDDKAGDRVGETREYVYITERGSVYHRKRSCSYLNVSVREVAGNTVATKRNEDGSKYYACGECVKGLGSRDIKNGAVYITDYGIRYHMRISCRELKRTVQVVPFSDAVGKDPCKKCGY